MTTGQGGTPEIDSRFFKEWVEYGLTRLDDLLAKYAAFDHYLETHPPEEPDGTDRPG